MTVEKIQGGLAVAEFPHTSNRQARGAQDLLGIGSIVFQTVAIRAPTDHSEALDAQFVLKRAAVLRDILEQDDAVSTGRPHPFELVMPVRRLLDQAAQCSPTKRIADEDPDLVAFLDQSKIE